MQHGARLAMWFGLLALALGAAQVNVARAVDAAPVGAASTAVPVRAADPFAPFTDALRAGRSFATGFRTPTRAGDGVVRAMAEGRVHVRDGEIEVEHLWLDNDRPRTVRLVVRGADARVADGAQVAPGDPLGRGEHVTLALVGEAGPIDLAAFVDTHRTLPAPDREDRLALVSHAADELRIFVKGVETARYAVGFGQAEGAKQRRGDNRTPKGVYYVVQKSRGPFGGPSAAYFGSTWMRLNYPNAWDAARGRDAGLITEEEQRSITRAWAARRETSKRTALGGGIGLHGWAYEWDDADPRGMSWGCVVMHLRDAEAIYAALPEGTMVILF